MAWVALKYDAKSRLFSLRVGLDDGQGGISSLRPVGVCSGNLNALKFLLQKHRSKVALTDEDRHRIEKYCKNRNVGAIARSEVIVTRSTTKLTDKRANERAAADPNRIALNANAIALTLPRFVRAAALQKYINKTARAVDHYLALLPTGKPRRRKHRVADGRSASAHSPLDGLRHGLIGELYEAYLSVRATDDPDVRGFKKTADATLKAAGLRPASEREQRYIRDQIRRFGAARNPDALGPLPKIDPLGDASDGDGDGDDRPNLNNTAIDG